MEPGHVVRENQQIMLVALAILDVIAQERFGFETHPFEGSHGAFLIDRHLRDHLLNTKPERYRERFLRQQPSETFATHRRRNKHTQLRHMRRPRELTTIDSRIALHLAFALGEDTLDASSCDSTYPIIDFL